MKTLSKLSLTLLTLFAVISLISCQQPKHETAADRAEQRLETLQDKLDSISEDDPGFGDNLRRELNDFENSIDQLANKMAEETDEAAAKSKAKIAQIREETNALRDRLAQWSYDANDSIDSLGSEIKESFRELKRSLRRHTEDNKWDDNK
jgi:peptidoglycan hydrolase CwlO-like protein